MINYCEVNKYIINSLEVPLQSKQPKVLIIGGGFGGIATAKVLYGIAVEVLLIDKSDDYVFKPLLYEVATDSLSPQAISRSIHQIFISQPNVRTLKDTVVAIDKINRQVVLFDGKKIDYDYLVIASGARDSWFGHSEWRDHAHGLRTVADAIRIRDLILNAFARAEGCVSKEEAIEHLRFVIVGSGPTGVELAGAISQIARGSIYKQTKYIKPENIEVNLVEGQKHILASYPQDLASEARKVLENNGVRVFTAQRVTRITEAGVQVSSLPLKATFEHGEVFDRREIPTQNVLWAAGNAAPSFLKTMDTPLDIQGRVIVQSDLSLPQQANVFVIGDSAHALDQRGQVLPGVAPVATQQGAYVASVVIADLLGKKRPTFVYNNRGMAAIVMRGKAILKAGNIHLSGFFAWVVWKIIHLWYLIDMQSRINVLKQWVFGRVSVSR